MNDFRNEEDALRRALDDAASKLPVPDAPLPVALGQVDTRDRRGPVRHAGRRRGVVALAAAVALALVVVTLAVALSRDDGGERVEIGVDRTQQLLGALAATVNSGGYDVDFTLEAQPGDRAATDHCVTTSEAGGTRTVCMSSGIGRDFQASGHGTVNTDPYAMTVVTQTGSLGEITLFVNGATVWQLGGANYGTGGTFDDAPEGASLSGFASLVEGTLGPGQGALSMISLANNSGYLGLEASAIERAVTDGDGVLGDGTHVTYYDVTIDVTKMDEGERLTDEQRQAVREAVAVLRSAGYTGTDERVGVDDAGFIREVSATTNFADGGSLTRHTVFSNFGCAARIAMPDEPAVPGTSGACPPVAAVTTTVPQTTVPPTTEPPTTTLSSPAR